MDSNSSGKWYKIAMLIIGVALIIFGGYKLYTAFKPGKVSQTFINKFNEVSNLARDISQTSALDLTGLEEKESAGDFPGALKIVNAALAKNAESAAKANTFTAKTAEFKALAEKITDPAAKASALKVADLLEKSNDLARQYLDVQKQVIEAVIDYYEKSQAGKKVSIPENLTALNDQATKLTQELQKVNTDYNTALNELSKNAGITLKQK